MPSGMWAGVGADAGICGGMYAEGGSHVMPSRTTFGAVQLLQADEPNVVEYVPAAHLTQQ